MADGGPWAAARAGLSVDARLWRRIGMRSRVLLVGIAVVVVMSTQVAGRNRTAAVLMIGGLVLTALMFGARYVVTEPSATWRRGWGFVGASVGLFALTSALRAGNLVYTTAPPLQVVSLLANIVGFTGLVVLMHHRAPRRTVRAALEALVVAGCVGYIGWVLTVVAGGTASLSLVLLSANAASAWVAARLLLLGSDRPVVLGVLAAGWAGKLAANFVAFTLSSAGDVNGRGLAAIQLWVLGAWVFGALHPSLGKRFGLVRERDVNDVNARTAVFASSVLMVLAIIGLQVLFGSNSNVVFVGASVLPTAVVLHMAYQMFDRSRVEYRATHDGLTGLPNRRAFEDAVAAALESPDGAPFALVVLDLDRFKSVNDSLGHSDGNLVLTAVAERLRTEMREPDLAARISGDEFALLLHGVDDSIADAAAGAVFDTFAEPFDVAEREVFISTSVGIAVWPTDGAAGDELLERADTALHEAKTRGRNRYVRYRRGMSARADLRLALESSLQTSIEAGEMALHYQPQVSLADGRVVGFEALARWRHPGVGFISPSAFVTLAEECGFIHALGAWAIEEACRQIAAWRAAGLPVVPVAVNVSAHQITAGSLADVVERSLATYDVPGELLEIELTESVLVDDFAQVSDFLDRAQQLGVRTAIDDFGTGYSGLRYLAQMPIDTLKIDRSFVAELGEGGSDKGIVRAVIGLAATLGLEVVAEGVETAEQAQILRGYGCDRLQGFLVSRAVAADDVPRLLLTETLMAWPAESSAPIVAEQPTVASPPADRRVTAVLEAVCRSDMPAVLDVDVVESVITALHARPSRRRAAKATSAA
ncbi:MAG TPA: bifunctional diguanylate cyclase/phosphodiesterase [Mycobacteriales bacterium]|jgi:diguanylate cyclase (GGDEF)-like protein|nr:bifunctional diguanylate cyclase/phosphodiesterase [Mycobacteriales bacterium]